MNKDPETMTALEITTYLNSGIYIPLSLKTKLQEKISLLKSTNRFNALDVFFAEISPNQGNQHNRGTKTEKVEKIEKFPQLVSVMSKQKKAIVHAPNYGSIFGIDSGDKMSQDKTASSLFVNGQVELEYDDFNLMRKKCAIFRIRLKYLILNRDMHFLDSMYVLDKEKAGVFKGVFKYDAWKLHAENLKNCILAYINLHNMIDYYSSVEKLLVECIQFLKINTPLENPVTMNTVTKLLTHNKYISLILLVFNNNLEKYHDLVESLLALPYKILTEIYTMTEKNIKNTITQIKKNTAQINDLITTIITANDPTIHCDYSILLTKTDAVVCKALRAQMYISCDSPITIATQNYNLTDAFLKKVNIDEFEKLINKQCKLEQCKSDMNTANFIKIITNSDNSGIYYYYKVDEPIPKTGGRIIINNLPKKYRLFTTQLKNYTLDKQQHYNVPIPVPTSAIKNNWLHSHSTNSKYQLSESQYDAMNPIIKKKYKYEETTKNKFTVDYIFMNLLLKDNNRNLIRPNMINSFRDLANETSSLI